MRERNDVTLVLWICMARTISKRCAGLTSRAPLATCWWRTETRAATLQKAQELEARVKQEVGPIPFVFLINKCDRKSEWGDGGGLRAWAGSARMGCAAH